MHRPGCRLTALLLTAGSIGLASAEPNSQTAPPNDATSDKEAAGQAKGVLDARQKAVDDIRYGRAAPYYLFPPAPGGPAARTPSPSGKADKK